MKVVYEREHSKSYLVIEDIEIDMNSYQIQMITNNNIPGALECSIRTINLRQKLYYDITSKLSLKQLLEVKKFQGNEIISIINNLNKTVEELQHYLLSEEYCILLPQYIYFQVDTLSPFICIYPDKREINGIDEFVNTLLEVLNENSSTDSEKLEYCLYRFSKLREKKIWDLKNSLCSYTVDNDLSKRSKQDNEESLIKQDQHRKNSELLNDLGNKSDNSQDLIVAPNEYTSMNQTDRICTKQETLLQQETESVEGGTTWQYIIKHNKLILYTAVGLLVLILILINVFFIKDSSGNYNIMRSFSINSLIIVIAIVALFVLKNYLNKWEDETLVEEEDFEFVPIFDFIDHSQEELKGVPEPCYTQYIETTSQDSKEATLVQVQSGERYLINDNPYIVGKVEGTVNLLLDAPTVSRLHAQITKRGDDIYIQDLNSKNGTFIDGKRLEPMDEHRLLNGEIIMIADVEFRYEV